MVKALVYKELRELLPWIALAALVELFLVSAAVGVRLGPFVEVQMIPFVNDEMVTFMLLAAGIFAAVAGLWQTVFESSRGTFQFLLHRPMRRDAIFGVKLVLGGGVAMAVCVAPLLFYTLWAATPGTHASPFFWGMSAYAWILAAQMPFVYLGAFLSGLRPGRWFGSRLFPLFAAVTALCLLFVAALVLAPVFLLLSVVLEAAYVVAILCVARTRDYS